MDYITDILEDVVKKIDSVGYEKKPTDDYLLENTIDKVKDYICNKTNQKSVPKGLKHAWIEKVVSEFLIFKMKLGQLDINGLKFERVAKEITEGDVRVVFSDTKSVEEQLEGYLSNLSTKNDEEIIKYRRIKW